jgi:hypothetical protein
VQAYNLRCIIQIVALAPIHLAICSAMPVMTGRVGTDGLSNLKLRRPAGRDVLVPQKGQTLRVQP